MKLPLLSGIKICSNEASFALNEAIFKATMTSQVHASVECVAE